MGCSVAIAPPLTDAAATAADAGGDAVDVDVMADVEVRFTSNKQRLTEKAL